MSGTDENDLVRKYAMRGFLVNVVVNRRNEWHIEVDSMVGPENGKPDDYVLVTVPSTLDWGYSPQVLEFVTKEIEANVKEKKFIALAKNKDRMDFSHWNTLGGAWGYEEGRGTFAGRNVKGYELNPPKANNKKSTWTYDKATQSLVESDFKGRIIKQITKGVVNIHGEDGKLLFKTNDRTVIGPRAGKNPRR